MIFGIDISWPDKVLWSNGQRGSHRWFARRAFDARTEAFYKAKAQIQRGKVKPTLDQLGGDPVPVLLRVWPKPSGRLPDRMNCASCIKAHIDGIADALGIDDRHFDAIRVVFEEPRRGAMRIELGAAE